MKQFVHAISTLSPVRRAAAFFAFLGFLTLTSCQKEEGVEISGLLSEQTGVYAEMTEILKAVESGQDPVEAATKLAALGEQLKSLKIKTAAVEPPVLSDGEVLPQQEEFISATMAFERARQELFMSGKLTLQIDQALMAHHNPAPMPGEGLTD